MTSQPVNMANAAVDAASVRRRIATIIVIAASVTVSGPGAVYVSGPLLKFENPPPTGENSCLELAG